MIAGSKQVHDEPAARRYVLRLHMAILATTSFIGGCATMPHGAGVAGHRLIERLAIALLVTVSVAAPVLAQNGTTAAQDGGTIHWDDGSFRAGDALRLEPHVRIQTDMR